MTTPYTPPTPDADAFNCPHCGAYSVQTGSSVWMASPGGGVQPRDGWHARICERCKDETLWLYDVLVHPEANPAPPPNADLSDDVRRDYDEAASIVARSPRGAAALLRLAIQKVCLELGGKGRSIDDDIAGLVAQGMSHRIQQAMDALRVIGNNAVHPGEIDLRDDLPTALGLFDLVNVVAETMISEPKRIEAIYQGLPAGALEAIKKRDAPKV